MPDLPIQASLNGTGALTAQTSQHLRGQAALSGAGALTANLNVSTPAVLVKSGELTGGRVATPTLIGTSDLLIPKT